MLGEQQKSTDSRPLKVLIFRESSATTKKYWWTKEILQAQRQIFPLNFFHFIILEKIFFQNK